MCFVTLSAFLHLVWLPFPQQQQTATVHCFVQRVCSTVSKRRSITLWILIRYLCICICIRIITLTMPSHIENSSQWKCLHPRFLFLFGALSVQTNTLARIFLNDIKTMRKSIQFYSHVTNVNLTRMATTIIKIV